MFEEGKEYRNASEIILNKYIYFYKFWFLIILVYGALNNIEQTRKSNP